MTDKRTAAIESWRRHLGMTPPKPPAAMMALPTIQEPPRGQLKPRQVRTRNRFYKGTPLTAAPDVERTAGLRAIEQNRPGTVPVDCLAEALDDSDLVNQLPEFACPDQEILEMCEPLRLW